MSISSYTVPARCFVATRKGLFLLQRTQSTGRWEIINVAFAGDNVSAVLPDGRDGSVYAALGHGHFGVKLHRSTDGGQSFTAIAAPVYPPRPADADDVDPVRQTPIDWSLELVWTLEGGGADRPGRLWAGTVPGGLFRSDDRGDSWQLCRGLWDRPERKQWFGGGMDRPGIHSIAVDPRDGDRITVGISCGGVWLSSDGGETWRLGGRGMRADFLPPDEALDPNRQDPHRLVACPAVPEVLWVQHHNGIFRSEDAADSWTELKPEGLSSFGFAVAVHPTDPARAWFIPAIKDEKRIPAEGRLVVSHTRDGGRTFIAQSRGLPQRWAYDLVFRHCLDVDDSAGGADRLMFGTTTGNLYATEDGGESWQTVSQNLPPIYCVRFA